MKRLLKEFELLKKSQPDISTSENMLCWTVNYQHTELPFGSSKIKLEITFSSNFPFEKPNLRVITKVFHPNISESGEVCLGVLSDWAVSTTVSQVIKEFGLLLDNPNILNPLFPEAAFIFDQNKALFYEKAGSWAKKYGISDFDDSFLML